MTRGDGRHVRIEQAIVALGTGLLAQRSNRALRSRLREGRLDAQDFLRQLVRLVFRQLFQRIAQARGLPFDLAEHAGATPRFLAAFDAEGLNITELGGAYEALLETHLVLDGDARSLHLARAAGHDRKTTGSYYTPAGLIECLLDSTLEPVLNEAAQARDAEGALLQLTVCDPACGSGLFLLAAARRIAHRLAAVRSGGGEPTAPRTQAALGEVVRRCIFGVDLNPMAVELCRFGLWLEAADPTLPPSFLDEHIRCGNSLLGATPAMREIGDFFSLGQRGDNDFFHWHLAFPQVFRQPKDGERPENPQTGWSGGFDVVLGNPPWEQAEIKAKEWFAFRRPDIARARTGAQRKQRIDALRREDPALYRAFTDEVAQRAALAHFAAQSGRYPLCGRGKINTYALFAETSRMLLQPAGRVGIIVPSGIATDDSTRPFFRDLIERRSLVSLYEFENAGFFVDAGQGHMNRFCLLTLTGPQRGTPSPRFLFRGTDTREIADPDRTIRLTAADLSLLNPNTGTCPLFRCQRDANLTRTIYRRVPILLREQPERVDPWGLTFKQGLFNMAADSALFRECGPLESQGWRLCGNVFRRGKQVYLPLYEAKMLHLFNHRHGDFAGIAPGGPCHRLPEPKPAQLADPNYQPLPRYWVEQSAVEERLAGRWPYDWLLGWRDVTDSRASARTVVAAIVPRVGVGHKVPLLFPSGHAPALVACLYANLASFALDYCARQKVGGLSLPYFCLKQLPVLPPEVYQQPAPWAPGETLQAWLLPRVLALTYTSHELQAFARDCGHEGPPIRWDDEERFHLRCELDAAFFRLYGVEPADVGYILETFPVVRRRDERRHGRYRTREGILAEYQRLQTRFTRSRGSGPRSAAPASGPARTASSRRSPAS